jgi:hypothetical protein
LIWINPRKIIISNFKHSQTTHVYPAGKVNPLVNAVAVHNPAIRVGEINAGRCRVFIITPKSNKYFFKIFH